MAGTTYTLLPRTALNFGSVPANGSQAFPIARGLDISQGTQVDLIFRLHSVDIAGGAASATVSAILERDAPSPDDPGVEFSDADTGASGPLVTVSFGESAAAATFKVDSAINAAGGWAKLIVKAEQPGTTPHTTFLVELSADMVVKS